MRTIRIMGAVVALSALTAGGLAGCSSDDGDAARDTTTSTAAAAGDGGTTATDGSTPEGEGDTARPEQPAATVAGPLAGGEGISLLAASSGPDLVAAGYTEAEYTAAGTATSYQAVGELPTDGRFELEPRDTADYTTRIVVRRPAEAADFNGTVVVEWLNVSSGADAAPDFTYLGAELIRGGYAWVGVSAQRIGIEGGPVAVAAPGSELTGAGQGLRAFVPERYADLSHPGDAYSYDLFTQVGQALRQPGDVDPLDGLEVEQLLAVGESQSAFALTTYADGVQPLTHQFDGFLIHSRGGAAAPLGEPDAGIDIAGTLGGEPTQVRDDLDVPVIIVETESDVIGLLGYFPARQPDSERVRLWEVAGTAHADAFQLGAVESLLECPSPINRGQQSFVLKAALRHLDTWAKGGEAPPEAERLEVDESGDALAYVVDEVGNTEGGIRTPSVDAPVDVLSGLPPEGASVICMLMGSTTPVPADQLAERYESAEAYLAAYEAAADDAVAAGFVLEEDREALLAEADPSRISG